MGFGHDYLKALFALAWRGIGSALLLLLATSAFGGTLRLAWDPVAHAGVAGYRIHYGPSAGVYTASINAGNTTSYTVPNLTEGATYHFAVTAYDASQVQGAFSNDVFGTVPYVTPVSDFTASTTSGAAPLAMNFINGSTGVITAYAWTFGDGGTSNAANPSHVYSSPGVYSVTLTVTGPGGSNTKTRSNYVTVSGSSDSSPPTVPASLTATASGTSTINLLWSASTDNVGVTGYRIERCQGSTCTNFAQVGTATGTSYSSTGLAAGTAYRYRVRAHDAAGNLSGYSPIAVATTTAAADTIPPTVPASLTATASGTSTINLVWSASTDNVGVTGYRIERCQWSTCTNFVQVGTATGTSYSSTGLAAGTAYRYRVRAHDAAGNLSAYSPIATGATGAGLDTTPPTVPASLTATGTGTSTINLVWSASTDNVGVTGYRIERCQWSTCTNFVQVGTATGTSYSSTGLAAGTAYRYRVRAHDAAGNLSGYSPIATGATGAGSDTIPPTVPASLTATASGTSAINLVWSASTDNVGVTGYRIERCKGSTCANFAQVGTSTGTSYGNTGLAAGTVYRYRVRANDGAGNLGGYSSTVSATTHSTSGGAPVSFVQLNYAIPQTHQATVPVTLSQAQTAGNLNVVVVGWNDASASVTSVTDSKGNTYTRAVGPTVLPGTITQSIYYAKNIAGAAAGSNTVTVKFSVPARFVDVRVVEYSGLDKTSPVDNVAYGLGSGSMSTTGPVTTSQPKTLLFSANTVTMWTLDSGVGYTTRIITSPNGDIVEDRVVTSAGTYNATAPVNGGSWVIQMVAFKAAP
jgi:PKD repeat protein